jgi:hypothetical protein
MRGVIQGLNEHVVHQSAHEKTILVARPKHLNDTDYLLDESSTHLAQLDCSFH